MKRNLIIYQFCISYLNSSPAFFATLQQQIVQSVGGVENCKIVFIYNSIGFSLDSYRNTNWLIYNSVFVFCIFFISVELFYGGSKGVKGSMVLHIHNRKKPVKPHDAIQTGFGHVPGKWNSVKMYKRKYLQNSTRQNYVFFARHIYSMRYIFLQSFLLIPLVI
jgi:hypothetical protein